MSSEQNRDELRLAMDACRADSRDLVLPAMHALAERLEHDPVCAAEFAKAQRQDRLLRAAIQDVPIPAGLVDRALLALSSEQPALPLAGQVFQPVAAKPSRPRYLAFGFTAAAAMLLVGMLGTYSMMPKVGSVARLEEEAAALLATPAGAAWSSDIDKPAALYPYEPWLRVVPKRCRAVTLAGDQGVLYDLIGVDEGGAMLLVISTSKRYELPTSPSTANAGSGSGLWRQIAWKQANAHSGLVYVLAMNGRRNDPKQLLRPQKLAFGRPGRQAFASR